MPCNQKLHGTFYFSASGGSDWTDPQDDARWRNGTKTLFDPCPAGWRVPDGGDGNTSIWKAFTADNRIWEQAGIFCGYRWVQPVVLGGEAWFPATGYRISATSPLTASNVWIHIRSGDSRTFRISQTEFTPDNFNRNIHGYSVRCIRE